MRQAIAKSESYFAGAWPDPGVVLIAERSGVSVGFAEERIRPMAEGCTSRGVGYLEGWYVRPKAQRHGVGSALLSACEEWARSQGCTEFASDTETSNVESLRAHLRCGFEVVETVHLFRKTL